MSKVYSLEEIAKHNTKASNLLLIHGDVYDVTKFLEEHPGGEEVLLDQGGKDASEAFEDVGHSSDARELMKQYKVGVLREEDKAKTKKVEEKNFWGATPRQSNESGGFGAWAKPALIAVAATILYRVYLAYSN